MIEYIIIGVLSVLLGVATYIIFNLLNKLEVYEEWVDFFRSEVEKVYVRLKEVDEKNLFEKDDDVGFVFEDLLKIVDEFNKRIK
jgi:hypothetical protein